MKLTAQGVYDKLVNDLKIIGQKAIINFSLAHLSLNVETRDTVGNLLQDWIKSWLISEEVELGVVPNSQDFPDFQLDEANPQTGLLEVKCFDYSKAANFDVANFLAYRRSLLDHPYRLDSNYLIIGYSMQGHEIEIKGVWLKKVWEITGPSELWPLKCQVKQGEVINIRPIKWYNNSNTTYKAFNSALEFVTAFDGTQRQWQRTSRDAEASTWLQKVKTGYKRQTGRDLV
jgi:type II restriction enzyme